MQGDKKTRRQKTPISTVLLCISTNTYCITVDYNIILFEYTHISLTYICIHIILNE